MRLLRASERQIIVAIMNRIPTTFSLTLQRVAQNRAPQKCVSERYLLLLSSNSPCLPVCSFHSSSRFLKKREKELSSKPTRFTSSPANLSSMPTLPERNEYQPFIVSISLFVFFIYFILLREENDVDQGLNLGLFERVPTLEEPHLTQAIPRMRDAGIDTREAVQRLAELRSKRLEKEALAAK